MLAYSASGEWLRRGSGLCVGQDNRMGAASGLAAGEGVSAVPLVTLERVRNCPKITCADLDKSNAQVMNGQFLSSIIQQQERR